MQPVPNVRFLATGMQLSHHIDKLMAVDQAAGTAVFQDELELVGHQPPVERHHHRPDFAQGEVRFHELRAVHQQQAHTFAFLQAVGQELVRQTVAARVELLIGEPLVSMAVYVCFPTWRQEGSLGKKCAQILMHRSVSHSKYVPREQRL